MSGPFRNITLEIHEAVKAFDAIAMAMMTSQEALRDALMPRRPPDVITTRGFFAVMRPYVEYFG